MKNYDRQGRIIAITIAVASVGGAAWYSWVTNHQKSAVPAVSSIEAKCTARVHSEFGPSISANIAAKLNQQKQMMAGVTRDTTSAEIKARLAESEYADKMADVNVYSAYCSAYAQCFPNKPFKPVFDACFETWTDDEDDSGNQDDSGDTQDQ